MEEVKTKNRHTRIPTFDGSSCSGSPSTYHIICQAKQTERSWLRRDVGFSLESKLRKHFEKSEPSDQRQRLRRCILSFETMELIFSYQELEPLLVRRNWTPGFLGRDWVEYHYHRVSNGHEVFKRVRVPKLMEDTRARKEDILKLVRTVNRMANENILCAWVQQVPLTSTRQPRSKRNHSFASPAPAAVRPRHKTYVDQGALASTEIKGSKRVRSRSRQAEALTTIQAYVDARVHRKSESSTFTAMHRRESTGSSRRQVEEAANTSRNISWKWTRITMDQNVLSKYRPLIRLEKKCPVCLKAEV